MKSQDFKVCYRTCRKKLRFVTMLKTTSCIDLRFSCTLMIPA